MLIVYIRLNTSGSLKANVVDLTKVRIFFNQNQSRKYQSSVSDTDYNASMFGFWIIFFVHHTID